MNKEKYVIKNTIGMFDLIKGIGMFFVVAMHTTSLFPSVFGDFAVQTYFNTLPILLILPLSLYVSIGFSMMPALFVVSGYGFRKRDVKKTIVQQAKSLLIPYFVTAVITIVFHFCMHYLFFRYFPGAAKETLKLGLGFLLGLSKTVEFGNYTIFSCGPVWFLLALFFGWSIFAIIVNFVKESFIAPTVICVATVGWGLSFLKLCPWCISSGLVSVFYLYLGMYIKKKKVFLSDHSAVQKLLYLLLVFVPTVAMNMFGQYIEMADNFYGLGPITIIETGLFSIFSIYCFLWLNRFNGLISGFIRYIGRSSLYLFCIHTIEMMGFPWYVVSEKVPDTVAAYWIFSMLRFGIDSIICFIFLKAKNIKKAS
ncbi:acyltransferase family protein [Butyrivibrio sp. NC2007]|uniref:acyltransferase family protein n=1 Tax=Butyrivibrio sp. NC2007 TaxID=1280683 RepID=UPI0003B5BC10|nr:acyltransferase family protein [Butyrivibrio sp. NC2007]